MLAQIEKRGTRDEGRERLTTVQTESTRLTITLWEVRLYLALAVRPGGVQLRAMSPFSCLSGFVRISLPSGFASLHIVSTTLQQASSREGYPVDSSVHFHSLKSHAHHLLRNEANHLSYNLIVADNPVQLDMQCSLERKAKPIVYRSPECPSAVPKAGVINATRCKLPNLSALFDGITGRILVY